MPYSSGVLTYYYSDRVDLIFGKCVAVAHITPQRRTQRQYNAKRVSVLQRFQPSKIILKTNGFIHNIFGSSERKRLFYLPAEFHVHGFVEERHTKAAEEHYQW